jgi:PAS domain S-box-containing protein
MILNGKIKKVNPDNNKLKSSNNNLENLIRKTYSLVPEIQKSLNKSDKYYRDPGNIKDGNQSGIAELKTNLEKALTEIKKGYAGQKSENYTLIDDEKYKALNSIYSISEFDEALNFLYINENFRKELGYKPQEVINKNIGSFIHPEDLVKIQKKLKSKFDNLIFRFRHKNGHWVWFENSRRSYIAPNDGKKGILLSQNITNRRRLEKQIIQSERLGAIEEMTSFFAHEFRNSLSSVKMIVQILLESENINHKDKKSLGIADNSINFLERILHKFLTIGSLIKPGYVKADAKIIIEEIIQIVHPQAKANGIIIKSRLRNNLPQIAADTTGLKESLINLIVNSIQAFEGIKLKNKVIVVSCSKVSLKKTLSNVNFNSIVSFKDSLDNKAIEGNIVINKGTECIKITVKDNAIGIEEKYFDQIFNLFFTTKENGVGLGLFIAKRIINAHKGILKMKSTKEKGSEFSIYLPIS